MEKIDKTLILRILQEYYQFKKDSDFAKFLGVTNQVYSNWIARNTFDIHVLYTKCVEISASFLITGNGEMLLKNENQTHKFEEPKEVFSKNDDCCSLLDSKNEMISALKNNVDDLRRNNQLLEKLVQKKIL